MAETPAMIDELPLAWALQDAGGAADRIAKKIAPLALEVQIVGTILGLLVTGVGVWLALAHRAQAGKPPEARGLTAALRWRAPIAFLLALCGVLVACGVWIDPAKAPGAFLGVWFAAMLLLAVTIVAAGMDLWHVRRMATAERRALVLHDRERLYSELGRRCTPPPANGRPE